MKKSIIYTGTGDQGTTSLVGGERVCKHDLRLDAYGTIDELSAHIGMLIALLPSLMSDDKQLLHTIQHRLFAIGAYLATDDTHTEIREASRIFSADIESIEQRIDTLDEALPQLHNFVFPGGAVSAAQAHICRTVCRRAERHICALHHSHPIDTIILQYVNRLSDYFFVVSRQCNHATDTPDMVWNKSR